MMAASVKENGTNVEKKVTRNCSKNSLQGVSLHDTSNVSATTAELVNASPNEKGRKHNYSNLLAGKVELAEENISEFEDFENSEIFEQLLDQDESSIALSQLQELEHAIIVKKETKVDGRSIRWANHKKETREPNKIKIKKESKQICGISVKCSESLSKKESNEISEILESNSKEDNRVLVCDTSSAINDSVEENLTTDNMKSEQSGAVLRPLYNDAILATMKQNFIEDTSNITESIVKIPPKDKKQRKKKDSPNEIIKKKPGRPRKKYLDQMTSTPKTEQQSLNTSDTETNYDKGNVSPKETTNTLTFNSPDFYNKKSAATKGLRDIRKSESSSDSNSSTPAKENTSLNSLHLELSPGTPLALSPNALLSPVKSPFISDTAKAISFHENGSNDVPLTRKNLLKEFSKKENQTSDNLINQVVPSNRPGKRGRKKRADGAIGKKTAMVIADVHNTMNGEPQSVISSHLLKTKKPSPKHNRRSKTKISSNKENSVASIEIASNVESLSQISASSNNSNSCLETSTKPNESNGYLSGVENGNSDFISEIQEIQKEVADIVKERHEKETHSQLNNSKLNNTDISEGNDLENSHLKIDNKLGQLNNKTPVNDVSSQNQHSTEDADKISQNEVEKNSQNKDAGKLSPKKCSEKLSPRKDADKLSPKKETDKLSLKKDAEKLSPKKDADKLSPKKDADKLSPKKDGDKLSPRKDADKLSPKKDADKLSPKKDADQLTPKKGADQLSPKKDAEKLSPKKETDKLSPKKDAEKLSPKKDAEKLSPKKDAGKLLTRGDTVENSVLESSKNKDNFSNNQSLSETDSHLLSLTEALDKSKKEKSNKAKSITTILEKLQSPVKNVPVSTTSIGKTNSEQNKDYDIENVKSKKQPRFLKELFVDEGVQSMLSSMKNNTIEERGKNDKKMHKLRPKRLTDIVNAESPEPEDINIKKKRKFIESETMQPNEKNSINSTNDDSHFKNRNNDDKFEWKLGKFKIKPPESKKRKLSGSSNTITSNKPAEKKQKVDNESPKSQIEQQNKFVKKKVSKTGSVDLASKNDSLKVITKTVPDATSGSIKLKIGLDEDGSARVISPPEGKSANKSSNNTLKPNSKPNGTIDPTHQENQLIQPITQEKISKGTLKPVTPTAKPHSSSIKKLLPPLKPRAALPPKPAVDQTNSKSKPKPDVVRQSQRSSARQNEASSQFKDIHLRKFQNFLHIILNPSTTRMKNSFNSKVLRELCEALNYISKDKAVSVVLFTATGSTFCQGVDLTSLQHSNQDIKKKNVQNLTNALKEFLHCLIEFPKTIIAGVNGSAVGLGVTMLPLFDLVFASDKAEFYLPYADLGQVPEGGATCTFPMGYGKLLSNNLFMGRKISAMEAQSIGLVSDIIWPATFMQELIPKVTEMAKKPGLGLVPTKNLMLHHLKARLQLTVDAECLSLQNTWQTPEFAEQSKLLLERYDFQMQQPASKSVQ